MIEAGWVRWKIEDCWTWRSVRIGWCRLTAEFVVKSAIVWVQHVERHWIARSSSWAGCAGMIAVAHASTAVRQLVSCRARRLRRLC